MIQSPDWHVWLCDLVYVHGDAELNQLQAFSARPWRHTLCHTETSVDYNQQAASSGF